MIVNAKYAISTLPLGVLQQRVVQFSPPFSKKKTKGIDGMRMGTYCTIYLQFSHNFWGNKEVLWFVGYSVGRFAWALNLDHKKYFPGSNIITFHMGGHNAVQVDSQSIHKTKFEIMTKPRNVYGESILDPIGIHVSNWTHNPFSYGSYSAWPLGYTKKSWEAMRRNEGRLYFAGEHTNYGFGYVNGAFDTGIKSAQQIIEQQMW